MDKEIKHAHEMRTKFILKRIHGKSREINIKNCVEELLSW
jgi:hypothetical protein